MVARLGEIAMERGLARVEIPFVAGQRNRPAELFLESLAAASRMEFSVSPPNAARGSIPPRQAAQARDAGVPKTEEAPVADTARRPDYLRIATELRTPEQIVERISAASRRPRPRMREADPPRTALERDLVELWADLLNLAAVGIHDNFFELGGHSLLAVQLLSRVRQIYGVDLSLEVVYSGEFTVAELAKADRAEGNRTGRRRLPGDVAGTGRADRRRSPRAAGRRAGCDLANADSADGQRIYAPPRGGATRSNLIWLDQMARRRPRLPHRLRSHRAKAPNSRITRPCRSAPWKNPARRIQMLRQQIREFQPDWVLVSSEDLGHGLMREAQQGRPAAWFTWPTRRSFSLWAGQLEFFVVGKNQAAAYGYLSRVGQDCAGAYL